MPLGLWRGTATAIVAHVALVWTWRYEWQFAQATRNGYAGFLLFHGALGLVVLSLFAAERRARVLVWIAFVVVTAGAIGAVYRYDVVAAYRAVVIVVATAGAAGLGLAIRHANVRSASTRRLSGPR